MDQTVCPSCWVWYPIETRSCKPCGVRLGGDYRAASEHARPFAERRPASVVWARRALILHAATLLILLVYASTSLRAAGRVYGPTTGAYLLRAVAAIPGASSTLLAGAIAGAAIGLAIQLLLVRWLFGRMLLLLGVGIDVWFTLLTSRADPSHLFTSLGLATAVIAAVMLAWSVARPNPR